MQAQKRQRAPRIGGRACAAQRTCQRILALQPAAVPGQHPMLADQAAPPGSMVGLQLRRRLGPLPLAGNVGFQGIALGGRQRRQQAAGRWGRASGCRTDSAAAPGLKALGRGGPCCAGGGCDLDHPRCQRALCHTELLQHVQVVLSGSQQAVSWLPCRGRRAKRVVHSPQGLRREGRVLAGASGGTLRLQASVWPAMARPSPARPERGAG